MPAQPEEKPSTFPAIDHLLGFVAERDEPCPVCGYSLRGLTEPRCPECGAPLTLHVGSPQLRVGAWVLAIVGFALGLGFDGVVSVLMMVALAANPGTSWVPLGIVTVFVSLAGGMLGGLVVVARSRAAWSRLPTGKQWLRGGTVFCCVGVLHGFVGLVFFMAAF